MRKDMITDEMLVDYLLGESSVEEKHKVESWMSDSPANKEYFAQFSAAWNASSQIAPAPVSNDDAWKRMQQRLHTDRMAPKAVPLHRSYPRYLRVAAMLLLFIGMGAMAYVITSKNTEPAVVANTQSEPPAPPALEEPVAVAEAAKGEAVPVAEPERPAPASVTPVAEKPKRSSKEPVAVKANIIQPSRYDLAKLADDCKTKGEICNGTPCPLQICIIQKNTCDKDHPYPISNCSILEPDKTGQLYYNGFDGKAYENCSLLVAEIKITRLTTGETITLNDHSAVTAQEFFNYITGKKQGEITAGIFRTDCNNQFKEHDLNMDNTMGGIHFR